MFIWKWIFKIKTDEIMIVLTKDNNPPSKTKAIIELAQAHAGGEGRSKETLLRIGYALKPKLLNLEKQIPVATAPLYAYDDATMFSSK